MYPLFPSVWDTRSCWWKMQSGIFCITVISGTSVMLIFTQAGRRFFIMSVLCTFMAYILMPEQSRFLVVYIVLHLYLTAKKQSYSECMTYWDFQSGPETLNLWNFKVDGTIKTGRKPMSSWKKKGSVNSGWAVELYN